jgi:hypothetical protein
MKRAKQHFAICHHSSFMLLSVLRVSVVSFLTHRKSPWQLSQVFFMTPAAARAES